MPPIKVVSKPKCLVLNQILKSKLASSAAGVHKPRSERQKRKDTLRKLLKDEFYE